MPATGAAPNLGGSPAGGTGANPALGGGGVGPTGGVGAAPSGGVQPTDPVPWINERGAMPLTGNDLGIQGDWYAFGDGTTSEASGNPFRDSASAYCVTGTAPGDEEYSTHWGAGIGFDLNGVGGDKLPYEFEGKVNGFRMRIEGEAPGAPRLQFVNDLDAEVAPFVPVELGETVTYWIGDAQVPLSWDVPNSGARVENGVLYSLQLMLPGAEEAGPIDVCITEFEPIYDPNGGQPRDDGPYINSDGYILAENNDLGLQGQVQVISDGNSTPQTGNPYSEGKYCVAGEFTGATDDWGAGIAFNLNQAPGGSAKEPYAWSGKIEGFRIGLSGSTPGTARIQFIVNEPQDGNQPFLAATLNTTMDYRIGWAQVPTSWDVADAGLEVGDSTYTVQVYLDGAEPGPFDVCVEDFLPVTTADLATVTADAAAAGFHGVRTVDDAILLAEYQRWKALHYRDCNDGSACVPRDDGDCISEGIGYGMLLAVAFDDRDAFDKLWAYYNKHKNSNGVMDWQTSACGATIASGSATDGELDAAMALVQAGCTWNESYTAEARTLIGAIRNTEVTDCSGTAVLMPGAGFGGCNETNPSYIAPGYYKVFEALTGDSKWTDLTTGGYQLLNQLQTRMNGLFPDWSDASGNPQSGDRGAYGPDASRVPWRVATDYVWNGDQRAEAILNNLVTHIDGNSKGIARLFTPNSNYRGGLALAGLQLDGVKAQAYADAWLETAVDDGSYFPGTLRPIYMLLATNKFAKGCQ